MLHPQIENTPKPPRPTPFSLHTAETRARRLYEYERRKWEERASSLITESNLKTFAYQRWSMSTAKWYAFKVSGVGGESPLYNSNRDRAVKPILTCYENALLSVPDAACNATKECGPGVNVGTYRFVAREYAYSDFDTRLAQFHLHDRRLWLVAFYVSNIAAIPFQTDGKFRLTQGTVVEEITCDEQLMCLGVLPRPEPAVVTDTGALAGHGSVGLPFKDEPVTAKMAVPQWFAAGAPKPRKAAKRKVAKHKTAKRKAKVRAKK
jgi:hypothetical protein